VLNFTAIDLQLYKIFKVKQVSFFWAHSASQYWSNNTDFSYSLPFDFHGHFASPLDFFLENYSTNLPILGGAKTLPKRRRTKRSNGCQLWTITVHDNVQLTRHTEFVMVFTWYPIEKKLWEYLWEFVTKNYRKPTLSSTAQTGDKPSDVSASTVKMSFKGSTTTTLQLINANTATATTNNTTQNMKYVTCIVCVNPIIVFSLQAASTTQTKQWSAIPNSF